jgi:type VI secretion system secreted protein Hcp
MKSRFLLLLLAFLVLPALSHAAAVDYFLKIDGVEGESYESGREGSIDILSWSWGFSRNSGTEGELSFDTLVLRKAADKSTPKLMEACAQGLLLPAVQLISRRVGADRKAEYLKITMEDVLISSYQTGGSSGDVVPTDQISFNFSKIEFEYIPFDLQGNPQEPVKVLIGLSKPASN